MSAPAWSPSAASHVALSHNARRTSSSPLASSAAPSSTPRAARGSPLWRARVARCHRARDRAGSSATVFWTTDLAVSMSPCEMSDRPGEIGVSEHRTRKGTWKGGCGGRRQRGAAADQKGGDVPAPGGAAQEGRVRRGRDRVGGAVRVEPRGAPRVPRRRGRRLQSGCPCRPAQ